MSRNLGTEGKLAPQTHLTGYIKRANREQFHFILRYYLEFELSNKDTLVLKRRLLRTEREMMSVTVLPKGSSRGLWTGLSDMDLVFCRFTLIAGNVNFTYTKITHLQLQICKRNGRQQLRVGK